MVRIDTLTAYKCKFSYMQRNNPLLDEQRAAIKAGELPEYTFSNFIDDYTTFTGKLAIGENSDRAILLSHENVSKDKINGDTIRWHLRPRSGKQGKPITVMKIPTQKQYNFGSDSAALYDHHVFVYENSTSIVAIFHRQNGSGCKSVFLETANKVLKPKGLKLEMDLYKVSPWDIVCFLFMPVALAAIITYKFQITIDDTLAQVFTTIFSLAFTVLFGFAAILVGKIDSKHNIEKQVVGETFVSIVSATLLCLISTILSIVTIKVDNSIILSLLSFITYSISFMIVMLVLLITKRTFIIYCNATNGNG